MIEGYDDIAVLWSGIKDQDSARGEILNAASRGDAQHTITYDDLLTAEHVAIAATRKTTFNKEGNEQSVEEVNLADCADIFSRYPVGRLLFGVPILVTNYDIINFINTSTATAGFHAGAIRLGDVRKRCECFIVNAGMPIQEQRKWIAIVDDYIMDCIKRESV